MRSTWIASASLGALLGSALLLGGCEDKVAKAKPIPLPAYNNTGTLDPAFGVLLGGAGSASYPSTVGGTGSSGTSIAIDGNSRILIGGNSETASAGIYDATIWRLFSNGVPDGGFGSGGVASKPNGAASDVIYSLHADGQEVVAIGQYAVPPPISLPVTVGLWRYTLNGTFKDAAVSYHAGTGPGTAYGLSTALDASRNVVIAGANDSGAGVGVWRFKSDDTLDSAAFNPGGTIAGHAGSFPGMQAISLSVDDIGKAVTLDFSGKIVVAGHTTTGATLSLFVTRLNTDGSADTTFNASGATPGRFINDGAGGDTEGNAILLLPNGQLLAAGYTKGTIAPISKDAALWRFNTDGTLDASFGSGGRLDIDGLGGTANVDDIAYSLALDIQGRILVAATTNNAALRMALFRLNPDGTPDTTFGTAAVFVDATYTFNNNLSGPAVTVAPDGRVYVTGAVVAGATTAMAVWKFK